MKTLPLLPKLRTMLKYGPLAVLLLLLPGVLLGLSGCASPNSSERTARAGDADMHQDVYRSQIEGFEYRVVVTEPEIRSATDAAGANRINATDAERRAMNYLRAAFPLRQSLVVQNVIEMPLLGTEYGDLGRPMTYFLVSLRSTHKPRFPQDVDMIKMVVFPNGQIVPFRARGQWISMLSEPGASWKIV